MCQRERLLSVELQQHNRTLVCFSTSIGQKQIRTMHGSSSEYILCNSKAKKANAKKIHIV